MSLFQLAEVKAAAKHCEWGITYFPTYMIHGVLVALKGTFVVASCQLLILHPPSRNPDPNVSEIASSFHSNTVNKL